MVSEAFGATRSKESRYRRGLCAVTKAQPNCGDKGVDATDSRNFHHSHPIDGDRFRCHRREPMGTVRSDPEAGMPWLQRSPSAAQPSLRGVLPRTGANHE